MKVEIEVPEYTPSRGVRTEWDDGYEIAVRVEGREVAVVAVILERS